MQVNYNFILFLVLLYLLTSWGNDDDGSFLSETQLFELETWLNTTEYEANQITHSNLTTPLSILNLTGIHDSESPSDLNPFIPIDIAADVESTWTREPNASAYFRNVSSILHGHYKKHDNLTRVPLNLDKYNRTLKDYSFDIAKAGKVSVTFAESLEHGVSSLVSASIYFADYGEITLHGLYLTQGHLALASRSLKFAGVKALPWILPPTEGLEDAKSLLVETLHNDTTEYGYSDYVDRVKSSDQCEWLFYGHLHSSRLSQEELDEIEKELENPQGSPVKHSPHVNLNGVLYSPDCGLHISLSSSGERLEHFKIRLRHALVGLLMLFLTLDALTIAQVQRTNSPTATYRISFWSIAITTLGDGLVCMICMLATYEKAVALQLMAIVVVVFSFITTVELDYMVSIFQSQLSESRSSNSDLSQSQVVSLIYSRLYIVLLCLCLVTVSSYGFKDQNRKYYEWVLLTFLYSNWWPQIYRNARKGFSQPFLLSYILGVSVVRLLPIIYFCFYPNNVGYHRYDYVLGWSMIAYQWLQVILLCSQYYLGGQFFLPEALMADVYDYHPILNTDLERLIHTSELPLQEGEEEGVKQVDCPICMNSIQLITSNSSTPAALLARRKYMVTPCYHVFHTSCLQEWMRRKLECPVCRTSIPAN